MIFIISFGVFFVCLIGESVTSWIFIQGSKKKYPMLWKHAGSPTLMGNGDLFSAWPLAKYILKKRYLKIDCKDSIVFAEKLRFPFLAGYFSAIVTVIWCFVALLIFGVPE